MILLDTHTHTHTSRCINIQNLFGNYTMRKIGRVLCDLPVYSNDGGNGFFGKIQERQSRALFCSSFLI